MPQSVVVSQSDSFVCIFPEYAQPKEVLNAINTSCSQIKGADGLLIHYQRHQPYLGLSGSGGCLHRGTEHGGHRPDHRQSGQIFFAGDLIKEQAYRHCVDNPYIRSYYQDTLEILRRYDAENDASPHRDPGGLYLLPGYQDQGGGDDGSAPQHTSPSACGG